ncbi:MAG: hypothetical protein Q4F05_01140 [bacterium]|nr:hypothetical protein [bacterium]
MKKFLHQIRTPKGNSSLGKQILATFFVLLLGIILGIISKYIDTTAVNELPAWFETLGLNDIFDRFCVWILLAAAISIYSRTPVRAAINTFLFFAAMVASYYIYCKYVAGFFPRSYAMIWVGFTLVSPFLAVLCWYAKGKGLLAFLLSSGIFAVLFNMTFYYGLNYFDIGYPIEAVFVLLAVFMLHKSVKQTGAMIAVGLVIAAILNVIMPFQI